MSQEQITNRLVEIGIALSAEQDINRLLRNIVDHSLDFTQADAASLYVKRGDELEFSVTRNLTLESRPDFELPFQRFHLPIDDHSAAGYVALTRRPVSIADVYHRQDSLPFQFDPSFDERVNYRTRSMLAVPLVDNKQQILGVLQLINHMVDGKATAFPESMMRPVEALAGQISISLSNALLLDQLAQSQRETVYRLCRAAEARDNETGNHIRRISHFARLLAGVCGRDEDYQQLLFDASPMHDIGKIGIPDAVLLKPGRLSDSERLVMNTHAELGYEMLAGSESPLLEMGAVIAQTHHEKWDGSGYPRGISGTDIPFCGRVTALVDVFDALSSPRVYKPAWPLEEVKQHLANEKGRHFDSELVDALFDNLDGILEIREQYRDEFEEQPH